MTKAARISQADVDRAFKALRNAGIEKARVILDYANQRIDIVIGEAGAEHSELETWSADDL